MTTNKQGKRGGETVSPTPGGWVGWHRKALMDSPHTVEVSASELREGMVLVDDNGLNWVVDGVKAERSESVLISCHWDVAGKRSITGFRFDADEAVTVKSLGEGKR